MGYLFISTFVFFPFYSYILIMHFRLGILGMVISMAIVEIIGLIILLYIFNFKLDPRISEATMDHGIFYNYFLFLKESAISISIQCPSWISSEFMVYFAAYSNSKNEMFLYTLLLALTHAIVYSVVGTLNYLVTLIST